jgi:hypothetical protein
MLNIQHISTVWQHPMMIDRRCAPDAQQLITAGTYR